MPSRKYERMKAEHRCVRCGTQDKRTLAGRIMCEECAGRTRRQQKKRADEIVQTGRCCICGEVNDRLKLGKRMCTKCAIYHSNLLSETYAERKSRHACVRCNKPLPDGYLLVRCEECMKKVRGRD